MDCNRSTPESVDDGKIKTEIIYELSVKNITRKNLKYLNESFDLNNKNKIRKILIREKDSNAAREEIENIGKEHIKIKEDNKIVLK